MNKKAQESSWILEQLLRLVVAAIVATLIIMILTKPFRSDTNAGLKSFDTLTNKVEFFNYDPEQTLNSFPLKMSEDSFIVGLSKYGDFQILKTLKAPITFKRPSDCKEGSSCICLCNKEVKLEENILSCAKHVCKEFKFDIKNSIKAPTYETERSYQSVAYPYKNGFIISTFDDIKSYYPNANINQKSMTVYMEETATNEITICEKAPCVSDQIA